MSSKSKKIIIFTGAGMSVPLDLPSTKDFVSSVEDRIRPITKHVMDYLGKKSDDIEWLLSTLETFNDDVSFTEFILPKMRDNQTAMAIPHLQKHLALLKAEAISETARIKKIIFDKLSAFDPKAAASLYLNLIAEIKEIFSEVSFSIITTNYDLTFEGVTESSQSKLNEFGISDVDYGFSIKFGRPIYDPAQDFKWSTPTVEYLKIHGSLDWHRDSKGRCSRSMSSTVPDDPDQMAILYPGFKGVPEDEPFISMHGRFSRRLAEADEIIVIGFAFRDRYINNIFENTLRTRSNINIYYFNPLSLDEFPADSSVPHFVSTYSTFHHINKGIGLGKNSLGLAEHIKKSRNPNDLEEPFQNFDSDLTKQFK